MFKNFFVIAWRNLKRKKSFSIINILGLSIGIGAAMLIGLWIQDELSYDEFHPDKERIYEVWNRYKQEDGINSWNFTPKIMASALQRDYPEVELTTRVNFGFPVLFSNGEKRVTARGNMVDSGFLRMFRFPLLAGDRATALDAVNSIVLTEKLAKEIFGNEDAMGKVVKVDNSDNFIVTAVLKDKPSNTRFNFEYLVSWAYLKSKGWDDDNWSNNSTTTYVKLKENASLASIGPKLKHIRKTYDKNDPAMEAFLYPFTRGYLHGRFENGKETGGRIEIVRLFIVIAVFILLIACINFMNLSTARSEKRAREVGVRKVMGAQRGSLIGQFLGESLLLTSLAAIIAVLLVYYSLPAFNTLVDKKLSLDAGNYRYWIAALAFIFITGILAGSYPAVYLSSFRPVNVLKGTLKAGNALVTPRKFLVVMQFTFAIMLVIATIIVRQQISKAQDRQAGYARANLVYHFMEGDVEKNYSTIKQELLRSGAVLSVTKTSAPITEGWSNTWNIQWEGKSPDDKRIIERFCADDAIVKTTGLQLVAGRDLDLSKFPADSNAALLNETAAKMMGFKDPVGRIVKDMGQDWKVVGIIKDFILSSPYHPASPVFIAGAKGWFNVIHLRLNAAQSTSDNIEKIKAIFKQFNPEYPFNYRFADEEYARKFNDEKRIEKLASLFALLTILISCLGLFGLASYMAENRIKEIGVRKVLGASVKNITVLLSKDFLKLVGLAFLLASPLAFWAMHSWLEQFPYRVAIQWWVFALAGLIALAIAAFTVSFQAIRAALMNPVKSLRTE